MNKPLQLALGLLFAICPLITVGAYGEAPNLLTYQGRLKEGGQAVTGNRAVEIFLCDDESAGTCHTSGSQPVAVSNGLFRSTFTIPAAANFGAGNWWLKINVGGTDLSPRERLTSNAYALFAATAAYASNISAASGSDGVTVSSNLFVSGNNFTVGGSTLSVDYGRVGIGTVNPAGALEIYRAGSGQTHLVLNNPTSDVALFIKKTALRGILGMPYYDERVVLSNKSAPFPGTADPAITLWDDGHMDLKVYSTGYINLTGGNVGISSATPRYRLVVSSGAGEAGNMLVISTGSSSVIRMTGAGEIYANYFSGDGSLLTNLPAAGGGVAKTGDTMTGQLTLNGSTLTILGSDSTPASLWVSTSAATPHLYVSTFGNVGLGTANLDPNFRLTVAGTVRITGGTSALIFPDGTTMNTAPVGGGTLAIASGGTGATDAATARTNLGLAIGTNVQAYDADLTTFAGITPSANVQTLLGSADNAAILSNIGAQAADADLSTYAGITPSANVQTLLGAADFAAVKASLDLEIGTDVQAYDADLTTFAGITPSANVQTLLGSVDNAAARANLGALAKAGDNMTGQLTLNGSSLTLRTGGTMNFTADAAGHVGINSLPDAAAGLNIYGDSLYEPGIRLDYGGQVWALHNNNGPLVFTKTDGDTATQLSLSRAGDLSVPNGAFSVGASTLIVRNDRVGIGTVDPGYKLHLQDSGSLSAMVESQAASTVQLFLKNSAANWGFIVDSLDASKLKLSLNSSPKMTFSGNDVGIGTVSPGYRLDVQGGSINASGSLCIADNCKSSWASIDNLGDHTATQNLNMAQKSVLALSSVTIYGRGLQIATDLTASGSGIFISTGGAIQTTGAGHSTVVGNARGNGAVDLQTIRLNAGEVASGLFSAIGGGRENLASGPYAVVSGGLGNDSTLTASFVGAGMYNTASGNEAAVAGGTNNTASADASFVGSGNYNEVSGAHSAIAGGEQNEITQPHSFIGGGYGNSAEQQWSVVAGGNYNRAAGQRSFVGGGVYNTTLGTAAMVPGGWKNTASGSFSFAAGKGSSSTVSGAFTWADSQTDADSGVYLENNTPDRAVFKTVGGFLITGSTATAPAGTVNRGVFFSGGGLVGIATGTPQAALDVVSTGTAVNTYAQIWRNGSGVVVASMTSLGVLEAGFRGPSFSPITVKSADYTALLSDEVILVDSFVGPVTITLPTAAGIAGKKYTVKAVVYGNPITVEPAGVETLDGAVNYGFLGVNESINIISDGANWFIISNN